MTTTITVIPDDGIGLCCPGSQITVALTQRTMLFL